MSLLKRFTQKNVGNFDRILRLIPFVGFVYLWKTQAMTGGGLIALGIFSVMLLATSLLGRCSIYAMLGLSTCKLKG